MKVLKEHTIEIAKDFADEFDQDIVVIIAFNANLQSDTVVTWGRSLAQAEYAATAANQLKTAMGWKPVNCHNVSPKFKVIEALRRLKFGIENDDIDGRRQIVGLINEIITIATT